MELKTKQDYRTYCLTKRRNMPEEEWMIRSNKIISQVLSSPEYNRAESVHCFVPMEERREVNTIPLLNKVLEDDKKLILPVTDFEKGTLEHIEVADLHHLETNKWGVKEPAQGKAVKGSESDLILVPLLAVDLNGNRLGYGKGFYDRFLNLRKGTAMGLVFSDFILKDIPVDPHDEPLDGFYSETGIHYPQLN